MLAPRTRISSRSTTGSHVGLLLAVLLATAAAAQADKPTTLKDAYKDHFYVAEDQELTDLETLGLPIHITELDVNGAQAGQHNSGADVANNTATTQGGLVDDANQRLATQYANLFKVFLKHQKSVKVVTLWGINDGVSWRADGKPLLFDGNDQPKPAFDAVIRAARGN